MTLENKWILFNALRSRKVRRKGKELEWSANPIKSLYLFFNLYHISSLSQSVFFNEYTSSYNNEKCRLAPLKIPAQECYITSFRTLVPVTFSLPLPASHNVPSTLMPSQRVQSDVFLGLRHVDVTHSHYLSHRHTRGHLHTGMSLSVSCVYVDHDLWSF